ncbi:hypothetical protein GQX73_g4261 [Xylaria multiplex]|uniref:UEV domain-containing protein n=1 Tax=Xylaria multiplex TaxID=323545 RepID=A0A7C8IPX5_9PEZI|nr:hypothetical protein GQX73_g4261 [Xylaria multiplex]
MVVQQHVLNWLYSILTSEYHDVNRTYNDVAQALSQYPSLSPRTDVHTFDNGISALLLHLSGTIPVVFRGTTYRFPISIWIPHAYPREPPLGYVTPTDTMMVRPGQHVDPQGRIYHPYLVRWTEFWDKSSLIDFLAILRDIFAKEPPVVSRQQLRPAQQQQSTPSPTPPPVPPLPPSMARPSPQPTQSPHTSDSRPPPPPPKGNDLPQVIPTPTVRADGPPLPPLPQQGMRRQPSQHTANQPERQVAPPTNRLSRYDMAPPLPPQGPQPHSQPPANPQVQPSSHTYAQGPSNAQYHIPQQQPGYSQEFQPATSQQLHDHRRQSYASGIAEPPSYTGGPPPNWQQPAPQQPPSQPVVKPPPPDLMDEPLALSLPSPSNLPAPPIPPNPEKDALLRQLASTLYAMRQRSQQQKSASLDGLRVQRTAMLTALQNIQNDAATLTPLSKLLASNMAIVQSSLGEADAVINNSKTHRPPAIDDLLVAPTVVGNQLYDVVAEERALGDAIFVLGRAVERGRISPAVFAKTTRGLAREWYLKKALARKIGRGMGLSG